MREKVIVSGESCLLYTNTRITRNMKQENNVYFERLLLNVL